MVLPFVYIMTPYTALLPTRNTRFAALLTVMFIKAFGIIFAFPSTTILLTNSCTSLRVLGTLNGFATTFSGIGRALGPATTGLAFTWGAENGYVVTAYFFLALIAALGAIPVFMIVEGDGPSASAESSDAEDSEAMEDSAVFLPDESAVEDEELDADEESPLLEDARNGEPRYKTVSRRGD